MTACYANPPAAYLGGKHNLAPRLVAEIAAIPHRIYVEPCVGMGGVFLRRQTAAPVEVINDLNGDVANLFRIVRRHYAPLVAEMRDLHASRAEFDRLLRVDPTTLTDIERAVRFYYLQRLAFGGKVTGQAFGVRRVQSSRIQYARIRAELRALSRRLQPVTIEQLPWSEVVRRYDDPQALFYLDPPYDQTTGYGLPFGRDQYERMAEQLGAIAGRFLLSINDTPFIRSTFAAFQIDEVETSWGMTHAASGGSKKVTELIIRNRPR